MLIRVFSVVSMLNKLHPGVCWRGEGPGGGGGGGATGLLNKGGGSNRLPGLVTEQQAVEFPQVLTSNTIQLLVCSTTPDCEVIMLLLVMLRIVGHHQSSLNFWFATKRCIMHNILTVGQRTQKQKKKLKIA